MKKCVLFFLAFILVGMQGLWAAEIDQSLQAILNETPHSEYIQVLVYLTEQADIGTLDSQLKQEKATLGERNQRVILALQEVATRTQPEIVAFLDNLKSSGLVEEYRTYWISNMFWARIKKAALDQLASRDDLSIIYFDYEIEGIEPTGQAPSDGLLLGHEIGLTKINATAAWAQGWTGLGRVVMNIDTGVLGSHPALQARFRGDVDGDGDVSESWLDPYTTHWPNPNDVGGHGTHTMGTICGRTASGDTIGVAIDAQWIAAAAIDRGGGIPRTVADAITSFQWAVDPDGNPNTQDNPDAIGNSWGVTTSHGYPPCDPTFWSVIDNCELAGSVVIFSAGNEGDSPNTLRRPADRGTTPTNCFSVGAIDGRLANMPIAGFSSRGPSNCGPNGEQVTKPEVVAPGVGVRSSWLSNGYTNLDGTSMASPHITGAVAVMRQVNPDLDADAIKTILMQTAVQTPSDNIPGEDNTFGWGIIDLYAACIAAQNGYGRVSGLVTDVDSIPIPLVQVTVVGRTNHDETDTSGVFSIGLPADTSYTFNFNRFGYVPVETTIALIPNDTVDVHIIMPLAPGGVIYGNVIDELTSAPIADATVEIADTPLSPVSTDQNGRYRFPSIPGGSTYIVQVRAIGHGMGRDSVFVVTGDSVELNFSLTGFESFEQTDAGWYGTGTWEWGQPTSGPGSAFNGTNVWATNLNGNYNSNSDDMLYSYFYSINQQLDTLTFYHWYEFENSYDGGNVSISTNDGANWALLTPVGDYPDNQVTGLDNLPGYTGSSGGWQQAVFPLIGYQGQIVRLRFWVGTNSAIVRAGWYLDGIMLKRGIAWIDGDPDIGVSQNSLGIGLEPDDSTIMLLTISNTGPGILSFEVRDIASLVASGGRPGELTPHFAATSQTGKGSEISLPSHSEGLMSNDDYGDPNPPITLDHGGPDNFGYTWLDSDEPNGPDFSWVDISTVGQPLYFSNNDNDGPYSLGFSMPFYGSTFGSIWICSNGWLSFSSLSTSYYNLPIPTPQAPNDLVAAFWDDLNPELGGSAYFYTNNSDTAIVSWLGVPHSAGADSFTFQTILTGDGNITLQYQTMIGDLTSSSVGIENSTGTIGLQVTYNHAYVNDSLAVLFRAPQDWMDVIPNAGLVTPGGDTEVSVLINATGLYPGEYFGFLNVLSNDPDEPTIAIPCTLVVGPVGVDDSRSGLPKSFELRQNYPNPFNPSTQISFTLPSKANVELTIYDLLGRKVRMLLDSRLDAGYHSVTWDGRHENGGQVTSGVYFYALKADDYFASQKMILMK